MKNLSKFIPILFLTALFPVVAFAQSSIWTIEDFIIKIHKILNSLIPVLVLLGVIYFVWGVVWYVIADSDEAKKKGKDRIIYGIIGLTVIVSVWGLVAIVAKTFGLTDATGPVVVLEDTCENLAHDPRFQDLVCYITTMINNSIIPLIFALAMVMFVWGVVQYVINSAEEAKKDKGRQFMLWGVIALTVMVSVWGLVDILGATFGVDTRFIPQVKTP